LRREKNERRGLKIEEKDRIGFNKRIGKRRMDGKYFKVGVDIGGNEKEGKEKEGGFKDGRNEKEAPPPYKIGGGAPGRLSSSLTQMLILQDLANLKTRKPYSSGEGGAGGCNICVDLIHKLGL